MTIASTLTAKQYVSTGSNTQFAYPNKIFAASDLLVTIFDPSGVQYPFTNFSSGALGLTYSVQGVDVDTGCTVVLSAPFTLNWTIDIRTLTAQTQSTSIKNQGSFLPELHEEAFDRSTRQTQDLMRLAYTYGIHGPDLETVPWPALPVAASRKGNALMFDAITGLPALGVPNTQTITTGLLAPFLNLGTTLAETQAGVTIVNFAFPPLTVDRYGTNTTPGVTVMTAAWQAAINVAKKNGGTVTFGPGPYLIDAALDLTFPVGSQNCSFAIIGQGRFKAPTNTVGQPATPSIIFKHTVPGHAFDTTGSLGVHFENLSIGTDNTNYPLTCFMLARNTDGSSRSDRIINCYVLGKFSKTILYNYGAEDGTYFGNQFYNISADLDTSVFDISGFNIRALTSTFTTIAVGSKSCIDHKIIGGEYANLFQGLGTTADVWRFDGARLISIRDVWCDSAAKAGTSGGRALVYIDGTNAASSVIFLSGVRGEAAPFAANYGIFVSNNARTHGPLFVEGCLFPNTTAMLGGGTGASISSLLWIGSSNSSQGGAINFAGNFLSPQIDGSAGAVVAASIDFFAGTWNVDQMIQKNGQVNMNWRDFSQASGSQWKRIRNGSGNLVVSSCDDSGNVVTNSVQWLTNGTTQQLGKLFLVQDTGAAQTVSGMYGGTGVPSNANGNNGDFYFRGDTPATANQRIYVKSVGVWVGIL